MENIYLQKIQQRQKEGMLRELQFRKDSLIDFCSNDYLGIASSKDFNIYLTDRISSAGFCVSGATGSRLLSGNYNIIEQLEARISKKFNSECALVFSSGYQANIALLSCVALKGDLIFYDESCHASLKDGIRLSLARKVPYKHNNLTDLKQKLSRHKYNNSFIVTETVFSMDGDTPDIETLYDIASFYNCNLITDEAHSAGIYGDNANGLTSHSGKTYARTITFGKAYGTQGGAILCSGITKKFIINFSRPFIYTTAPSPLLCISVDAAFDFEEKNQYLKHKLLENIKYWKNFAEKYKELNISSTNSAIQKIIIPGNENVKKIANLLQQNGYFILPVLYPTVQKNTERLRIVIHSFNCKKDIEHLFIQLKNFCNFTA